MEGGRKRILVADDNTTMATVIQFNLERAGYATSVAHNGRQAWELLQAGSYDLLVTDHQMPELCGSELCQRVRQDARFAGLPIIMLTAKQMELEERWLREQLGVVRTMPKPFSPSELISVIAGCLTAPADTG